MKRIVFLDYVRVFACFLVMVVHASENFYVPSTGNISEKVVVCIPLLW